MNQSDKKVLGKVTLQKTEQAQSSAPRISREEQAARDVEELKALSEQHGVPGIDLNQVCVRLSDLEILPREIAERRLILPVLVRDDRVFVAMINPGDKKVIDELEFVTGKRVFAYVALKSALESVIRDAYDSKARGEQFHIGPLCPPEIQRKMGVPDRSAPPDSFPTAPAQGQMFPDSPPSRLSAARMDKVAEQDELSYNEFGDVDPELSVVAELPQDPPSRPAPIPTGQDQFGAGKTVLIVDDEIDIRKLLRRVLQDKGFKVVDADRGLEALRMVKAHMPDLMVLDAMLPEVNGFEIARRIKSSGKYAHIPIVMVSAVYKGWRVAEDARASYGVDAFVEKPFKLSDIIGAIEGVLKGPGKTEEAPAPRDPDALSGEAEQLLNAGVAAYQAGDIDSAIAHLRRGLEIDPLAFRLHFHLGLLYGKKGMIYEAIQEVEQAVQQNEKHFGASKNLAVLYQKAGFRNKAVDAWQRALRVAPDDPTRESIKQHLMTLL